MLHTQEPFFPMIVAVRAYQFLVFHIESFATANVTRKAYFPRTEELVARNFITMKLIHNDT